MHTASRSGADAETEDDVKLLHDMGYAQELTRRLGRFSNFAISFSIICILAGGINSLAQVTSGGGGAAIGLGWPLGVFVSGVFGLAMAQIASAYPTAGGLYHWGSILGNRFTGWLTAWFNLLGLVTVLGSINVGAYNFFLGAFGPSLGMLDTTTARILFLTAVTGGQALINHYGIGLTAKLTDFSGYLIFGGSLLLTALCLVYAPSHDWSRLWTFTNYSGTPAGATPVWPHVSGTWVFLLGLLLPVYTITGYDASAHTSEETRNAALSVPKGIVSSILWSGVFGYLFLCAFVLVIPNMGDAATQGWNVFFWAMDKQVPWTLNLFTYAVIFLAQVLCGLATVTSLSRMMFAFSRDGGLPFSRVLARVSPRHRTPNASIWAGSALSVLFVWGSSVISIGDTPVYSIVVSCTVIFLFFSFIIPITCGLFAYGGPKWPKMGPWNIGRGGYSLFALLSVIAMVLLFVIGVQPPNDPALWVTLGFLVLTAIVWFAFESRRFKGPPTGAAIARREAEIAAAEAALGKAAP
jgi:amino acid transporter